MSRPDGWPGYLHDVKEQGVATGVAIAQLSNGAVLARDSCPVTAEQVREYKKNFADVSYFQRKKIPCGDLGFVYLRGDPKMIIGKCGKKSLAIIHTLRCVLIGLAEGDQTLNPLTGHVDNVARDLEDCKY